MSENRTAREEAHALVEQLRWVLGSLQASGIRDWPSRPRKTPSGPLIQAPSVESVEVPEIETSPAQLLSDIRADLGDCRRCRLHTGRTHLVFGEGSHLAEAAFVGEGPGFDEDRQGRPFVGRAGKLLNAMIKSLGFQREEVYICNVVKCRPPDNRTPNPDEIEACSPFLVRQLEALRPRVICALGGCAAQTLLSTSVAISRLRGKVHYWRGIPLVCTFHPAYLLRNPASKAQAWQDLIEVHRLLGDTQRIAAS